jgi:CheY-like chemotaxis protein
MAEFQLKRLRGCFASWIYKLMKATAGEGLPNDVLIVEDDPIIALDFEDRILGFGVKTVRTAQTVAKAFDMIAEGAPDFALLDVGLIHEKCFAIADRLKALDIPFIFVTGYGREIAVPLAFSDRLRLSKPCSSEALAVALKEGFEPGRAKARNDVVEGKQVLPAPGSIEPGLRE